MLSKILHLRFVDVTTVDSIVRTKVAQIYTMLIVNSCYLNVDIFYKFVSYHILPDYGPYGRYLRMLQSKVRRSMFYSFQWTRCRLGIDLEKTLMFKEKIAYVNCSVFYARFNENDLISCFKILNPTNMPSRQIDLHNRCISELETLLGHYGKNR